jgi:DnaK suppressor protein
MTTDRGAGGETHAGAGRQPRAHPDSELGEEQTETLYRMLVEKQQSLLEGRRRHLDMGRFTTERITESEEAAAWDTSQSTLIDLAETERRLLLQIERALRKMHDGTYGVSEESGEPIGFDRLKAIPWAAQSAVDQERLEHRARERGR